MRSPGSNNNARHKSAALLSSTGALALGIGLAAALSAYIGRAALPILVAGTASDGWGMFQKHRPESNESYTPALWEKALYWACWAALAVLLLLTGVKALAG